MAGVHERKALVAPGMLTRRSLPGEEDDGDSHAASVWRHMARRQAVREMMSGFLLVRSSAISADRAGGRRAPQAGRGASPYATATSISWRSRSAQAAPSATCGSR